MLGLPLGRFAFGGQHRVLPARLRVGSLVAIVTYVVVAAVVLQRSEVVDAGLPDAAVRVGAWVLAAYFLVGVGLNLASRSRAERFTMTPVALVLFVLTAVVAID